MPDPVLPAPPGFEPDPDALARYRGLIAATLERIAAAEARLPGELDPRPLAPDAAAETEVRTGRPGSVPGYGARGWGDLCDRVAALGAGETTASEWVEAGIARVERRDGTLRGVVALEAERARGEARRLDALPPAERGPLAGAPYARKDLFARAGHGMACGSPLLADHVPDRTATVLERLDAAGGVDLGRLAMAEFAMSPTGFNAHEPHPRNPFGTDHVPGGSSSGSGVAVAAGYVPLALGTDTGGSVRHPAAACALTGLKPTAGRLSRAGVWPLSWTLDCPGPLARSARDCALALALMAGPDPRDTTVPAGTAFAAPPMAGDLAGVRIAMPGGAYAAATTPAVAAALAAARGTFETLGAVVVDTEPPDLSLLNALAHLVLAVEAASLLRPHLVGGGAAIGRQVRDRIEPGLFYPASHYAHALRLRAVVRAEWLARAMADADAALLPAFPREVPTIAETTAVAPEDAAALIGDLTIATRGVNYLGLPALAAPCGVDSAGLPIAFQIVGRPFAEGRILSIADAFQRASEWHRARPFPDEE